MMEQQFDVANDTELVWFGIMRLAKGRGNGLINYNTVIDSLQAQGFTNSKLFSVNIGSQGAPNISMAGEMVFWGVDRSKFACTLSKVVCKANDAHYTITLTSLLHRAPDSSSKSITITLPLELIVDSGTTLTFLPEPLVQSITSRFPSATSDGAGGYRNPCAQQNLMGSIEFDFGSVRIAMPHFEFIWNSGGTDNCFLSVWSDPDINVNILGDSFLRGAYVVFDQDSNALFVGNYTNCDDSDLVPVPAGVDAAAGIRGDCTVVAPVLPSSSSSTVSAVSTTIAVFSSTTATVVQSVGGGDGSTTFPGGLGISANPTVLVSASGSSSSSFSSASPAARGQKQGGDARANRPGFADLCGGWVARLG